MDNVQKYLTTAQEYDRVLGIARRARIHRELAFDALTPEDIEALKPLIPEHQYLHILKIKQYKEIGSSTNFGDQPWNA